MMMMTPMNEDVWSSIKQNKERWVGRRFEGNHPLSPFWAIHPNGAPGLVIGGIPVSAIPKELPLPRGIVMATEVSEAGDTTLTMFLQTPDDRDVFQRLCEDIVSCSATANSTADACIQIFIRLRRWQSLLGLARGREMSDREVRGLLAELWMLLHVLTPKIGIAIALRAWVAPDRHPQDFALPGGILEIKARLTGSRPEVHISSLEQLECIHLPLHLVVVELTPSDHDQSALSLNDLAESLLIAAGQHNMDTRDLAHAALANRGYVVSPRYDALSYSIAGAVAFQVKPDFPRILRGSTDARVTEANYSLALTALGEYREELVDVLAIACDGITRE